MSRTHKDKPWKHADQQSRWDYGRVRIPYESDTYAYRLYFYLDEAGVKTKKKRSHVERHCMPTPMWWIREMMNQPQRTRSKQWERGVMKWSIDDIEEADAPYIGRKPHIYYW